MIGALIANFTQNLLWKKWVMFLLVIPLVGLSYLFRNLLILGLVSSEMDGVAKVFYHDNWSALFQSIVILLVLWFCSGLLKKVGLPH